MKRLSCIFILLFLLQNLASAQSTENFRRWRFGVLAGPQFSTYVPNQGGKWLTGWMAGADVNYAFRDSRKGLALHIQPTLAYARTESLTGDRNGPEYYEYVSRTTNIQLPVLLRYKFLGGKIRPFAEAGVQGSYLASWYIKNEGRYCLDGTCFPFESSGKVNSSARKATISALAGAGVEIDAGIVTIPVTVRLVEQIKKRETIHDIVTGASYRMPRARSIQVSVGVMF